MRREERATHLAGAVVAAGDEPVAALQRGAARRSLELRSAARSDCCCRTLLKAQLVSGSTCARRTRNSTKSPWYELASLSCGHAGAGEHSPAVALQARSLGARWRAARACSLATIFRSVARWLSFTSGCSNAITSSSSLCARSGGGALDTHRSSSATRARSETGEGAASAPQRLCRA